MIWSIPISAKCPHCRAELRQAGGAPELRAACERKFRSQHFDACKANPARRAAVPEEAGVS